MSPDQTPQPQATSAPATPPLAAPQAAPAPAPITTPTPPPAAPAAAPAAPQAPASAPLPQAPATPLPATPATTSDTCKCPTIIAADWDKKKTTINKIFYKAYSPRLFYYPFSFVIDVLRAQKAAMAKGCKVVENGSVMSDCAMFMGNVFVEVTGANPNDPHILSLTGKEVYTKVSKNEYKNIKQDIDELTKELGKAPEQLYLWWTSCPKCMATKEVKAVLVALS